MRGFGPLGLLSIAVIFAAALFGPLPAGVAVLLWAWLSKTPLSDLGLVRPNDVIRSVGIGAIAGVVFKLLMKAIVMPLLGGPAVNPTYHFLQSNAAALPGMIGTVLLSAGFSEELFFRGYIFDRVGALAGRTRAALGFAVVLSTSLFAFAHYPDQGWPGVEQAGIVGIVLGVMFAQRRSLVMPMVTHAVFDLTAVTLIYFGWEERVAHFIFK